MSKETVAETVQKLSSPRYGLQKGDLVRRWGRGNNPRTELGYPFQMLPVFSLVEWS
jgi:hypothetical protein